MIVSPHSAFPQTDVGHVDSRSRACSRRFLICEVVLQCSYTVSSRDPFLVLSLDAKLTKGSVAEGPRIILIPQRSSRILTASRLGLCFILHDHSGRIQARCAEIVVVFSAEAGLSRDGWRGRRSKRVSAPSGHQGTRRRNIGQTLSQIKMRENRVPKYFSDLGLLNERARRSSPHHVTHATLVEHALPDQWSIIQFLTQG